MKIRNFLILLIFLVGTTFGQSSSIERSNWNSAKIDAWATPPGGAIFDGDDDVYSIPDNDNLSFSNLAFSLNTTFTIGDLSAESIIVAKSNNQTNQKEYTISIRADGAFRLYLFDDGGSSSDYSYWESPIGSIVVDEIYDVWATFDGTTGIIYINGAPTTTVKTDVGSGFVTYVNTAADYSLFAFPADSPTAFIKGVIYQHKAHNHALTQAEVMKVWNNGEPHLASTEYKYVGASQDNKVTNGDFAGASYAGWTGGGATTLDATGNELHWTGITGWGGVITNVGTITAGKIYRLTFTYRTISSSPNDATIGLLKSSSTVGTPFSGVNTFIPNELTESSNTVYTIDISPTETATGYLVFTDGEDATPTEMYLDDISLTQIGKVLHLPYNKAGVNGWVDISGNGLHANSAGDPIAVMGDWDVRTAVSTSEVELVTTQKAGYRLIGVDVFDNSGSANTYFIGTSTGVYDIAPGVSISANGTKFHNINQLSLTGRSLFIKSGTSSCDFILSYVKVK